MKMKSVKADLKKIFGTAHFKKSTQQLKEEMREGWEFD